MSTRIITPFPLSSARVLFPRTLSGKGLAAMFLAAFVSALIVAADLLVETYGEGHLLVGWISLWAVGFAALTLLGNPARRTVARVSFLIGTWGQRREQRRSDAYLLALAQHDPRIMAEVHAAMDHAGIAAQSMQRNLGHAWMERQPVGTFNAAYQGIHNSFRTTPLTGLPTHLQYFPG